MDIQATLIISPSGENDAFEFRSGHVPSTQASYRSNYAANIQNIHDIKEGYTLASQ